MTFEEREKLEELMNKVRYVKRVKLSEQHVVLIDDTIWYEFYEGLKKLRDNDRKFETRT
jgi:hypothetical protein